MLILEYSCRITILLAFGFLSTKHLCNNLTGQREHHDSQLQIPGAQLWVAVISIEPFIWHGMLNSSVFSGFKIFLLACTGNGPLAIWRKCDPIYLPIKKTSAYLFIIIMDRSNFFIVVGITGWWFKQENNHADALATLLVQNSNKVSVVVVVRLDRKGKVHRSDPTSQNQNTSAQTLPYHGSYHIIIS